jgi:multiple sugar transport system ATP-binding protein
MNLIQNGGTLIGFRPERFLPLDASPAQSRLQPFKFEVRLVEDLGADRLVYGDLGSPFEGQSVVSRMALNINLLVEAGNTYTFAVPEEAILFFDLKTGQRVAYHQFPGEQREHK